MQRERVLLSSNTRHYIALHRIASPHIITLHTHVEPRAITYSGIFTSDIKISSPSEIFAEVTA